MLKQVLLTHVKNLVAVPGKSGFGRNYLPTKKNSAPFVKKSTPCDTTNKNTQGNNYQICCL